MTNWYYFAWLCGDHIAEQHVHNIDVINWFKSIDEGALREVAPGVKLAHPVSAQGMGGREVRTGKEHECIFDHHYVEFTYADGSVMNSQCRHIKGCWNRVDEMVQGTKGSAGPGWVKVPRAKTSGATAAKATRTPTTSSTRSSTKRSATTRRSTTPTTARPAFSSILDSLLHLLGQAAQLGRRPRLKHRARAQRIRLGRRAADLPDENGYPVAVPGGFKAI
ncbi:MAG: hypothetical protein R3F11_24095 [Verrucomicrobiales bacterium]